MPVVRYRPDPKKPYKLSPPQRARIDALTEGDRGGSCFGPGRAASDRCGAAPRQGPAPDQERPQPHGAEPGTLCPALSHQPGPVARLGARPLGSGQRDARLHQGDPIRSSNGGAGDRATRSRRPARRPAFAPVALGERKVHRVAHQGRGRAAGGAWRQLGGGPARAPEPIRAPACPARLRASPKRLMRGRLPVRCVKGSRTGACIPTTSRMATCAETSSGPKDGGPPDDASRGPGHLGSHRLPWHAGAAVHGENDFGESCREIRRRCLGAGCTARPSSYASQSSASPT